MKLMLFSAIFCVAVILGSSSVSSHPVTHPPREVDACVTHLIEKTTMLCDSEVASWSLSKFERFCRLDGLVLTLINDEALKTLACPKTKYDRYNLRTQERARAIRLAKEAKEAESDRSSSSSESSESSESREE